MKVKANIWLDFLDSSDEAERQLQEEIFEKTVKLPIIPAVGMRIVLDCFFTTLFHKHKLSKKYQNDMVKVITEITIYGSSINIEVSNVPEPTPAVKQWHGIYGY